MSQWAVADAGVFCCGLLAEIGAPYRDEDHLCERNAVGCLGGGWARRYGRTTAARSMWVCAEAVWLSEHPQSFQGKPVPN